MQTSEPLSQSFVFEQKEDFLFSSGFYLDLRNALLNPNAQQEIKPPTLLLNKFVDYFKKFQFYVFVDINTLSFDYAIDDLPDSAIRFTIQEKNREFSIICQPNGQINMSLKVDLLGILHAGTKTLMDYCGANSLASVDPKRVFHAHYFHQAMGRFVQNYHDFVSKIMRTLCAFSKQQASLKKYSYPPSKEAKNLECVVLRSPLQFFSKTIQALSIEIPVVIESNLTSESADQQFFSAYYFVKIRRRYPLLGIVTSIVTATRSQQGLIFNIANLGEEIEVQEAFCIEKSNPNTVISLCMKEPVFRLCREESIPSLNSFPQKSQAPAFNSRQFPQAVNSPMNKFTTFISTLIWGTAEKIKSAIDLQALLSKKNGPNFYSHVDAIVKAIMAQMPASSLRLSWRGFARIEDILTGSDYESGDTVSILDNLEDRGETYRIIQIVGPHWTSNNFLKTIFPLKEGKYKSLYADPQNREKLVKLFIATAQVIKKSGADGIDINCGCPVNFIYYFGGGAGLMHQITLVVEIIEGIKKALGQEFPIGVKIRNHPDVMNFIERCLEAGVHWIAMHPNTREQGYHYDTLDDNALRSCKRKIDEFNQSHPERYVHFIINGGVLSEKEALEKLKKVEAENATIMVGRGARGNPFIISQLIQAIQKMQPSSFSFTPLELVIVGIIHLRYLREIEGFDNLVVLTRFAQEYYRTLFDLDNVSKTLAFEIKLLQTKNLKEIEQWLLEAALDKIG